MGATGTGGDGGIVRDECVSISLGGGTRIFPQIALAIGVLTSLVFFFFHFFFWSSGPFVPWIGHGLGLWCKEGGVNPFWFQRAHDKFLLRVARPVPFDPYKPML